jgi:carbamoyltransferase
MYVLGLSFFYHDSAAALLRDGEIVAAAEEERFSRVKHDFGFPELSVRFCLEEAGITARDLDYVVFYEKPLLKFERIIMTAFRGYPRSWRAFGQAMMNWFGDKLWIKTLIRDRVGVEEKNVLFEDHHLSHAASAFYPSPFEEAAVLTLDGVGEWTTATLGRARGNEITLLEEIRFPNSLGLLYSAFTAYLGFQVNEGEYKVMGMAPYGEPKYTDRIYDRLVDVAKDGSFRLNMDYFAFHYSDEATFNSRFVDLFGKPRDPKMHFFTSRTRFPSYFGEKPSDFEEQCRLNEHYADVAASIQRVTEDIILKLANDLHHRTGLKKLCLAGGVALNSVANGRILLETPFEELFIQPAAGDSGAALGAALHVYHGLLGRPRRFTLEHAYWGKAYGETGVRAFLETQNIRHEIFKDDEKLLDRVVDDLTAGKVVGWFQGRFEWGPRALGNRSILADPRSEMMKDTVNIKIKFREPFRPFAPVILEERTADFFQGTNVAGQYPARYMLLVLPFKAGQADKIAAVNHMGTGRLQTIRRSWNPRYYDVVDRFGRATGIPVLLNTSFNLRGEPIVASPEDAYNTFRKSGIDVLVMENAMVRKDVG